MTDWGKPCDRCGHPASYHGVTFCLVRAGAAQKRDCDCPGYTAERDAARADLAALVADLRALHTGPTPHVPVGVDRGAFLLGWEQAHEDVEAVLDRHAGAES